MFYARLTCFLISIIFLYSIFIIVTIQYIFSYVLETTFEEFNANLNKTSTYRKLPYPMYFPFDISVSDGYFWYAFFFQMYMVISLPCSFACIKNMRYFYRLF